MELDHSDEPDKLASMTNKTKAQKIAASLRSRKMVSYPTTGEMRVADVLGRRPSEKNATPVYNPEDLRKTFATSAFIIALLSFVFVLQFKGYF